MKSLQIIPWRNKGTFLGREGSVELTMDKVLIHFSWQGSNNHTNLGRVLVFVGEGDCLIRSSEELAEQAEPGA